MGYARLLLVLSLVLVYMAHEHVRSVVHPPLALARPVHPPQWGNSTFLCHQRTSTLTQLPYCVHLLSLASPSHTPLCHLLLIPGTSSHSSQYHSVAHVLTSSTRCSLHSVDLMGHGLSGGDRGVFTLHDFILDIEAAAAHIQRQAYLQQPLHLQGKKTSLIRHAPIFLLGSSQGGEVAYQALARLPQSLVSGAISMNLWLSPRLSPSPLISLLTHPLLLPALRLLLQHVWVPLPLVLPVPALYSAHDRPLGRLLYEERLRDPLTQWTYSLPSYLSLFLPPPLPPSPSHTLHRKRLLIVCGELDPVIRWQTCEQAWRLLREDGEGQVELYVWPGGPHQLLLLEGERFARLIAAWLASVSEDIRREWKGERRSRSRGGSWQLPEGFKPSLHHAGEVHDDSLAIQQSLQQQQEL